MEIADEYSKLDELTSGKFNFSLSDIPVTSTELYSIKRPGLLIGSKEALEHQYLVQGDIRPFLSHAPEGYFLIGFWGHGFNSYAFYYLRVDSISKIFFRLPYGGVYMDNKKGAERIGKFLPEFFDFEEKLKTMGLRRLYAVESMGSGWYEVEINDQVIECRESFYARDGQFDNVFR